MLIETIKRINTANTNLKSEVLTIIIVKLLGGLGNQMFQYAFGRYLQETYNDDLFLDISVYKKYRIRSFSLKHLNISNKAYLFDSSKLKKFERYRMNIALKTYHLFQRLYRSILHKEEINPEIYNLLCSKGFIFNFDRYYHPTKLTAKKIKYVYGYFQSEKYFRSIKNKIKNEFKVKTKMSCILQKTNLEIEKTNSVGVSIRIGDDYKNNKDLNVCDLKYYISAISYLRKRLKDPVFYIFSDDIEKVRTEYKFDGDYIYIENAKDYEGLQMLSSCKHFIISNSSFAWWGSYLSENNEKIIIAPNRWYNNTKSLASIYNDSITRMIFD